MAKFTIEFTKTEVTRERLIVEADSLAEAIQAVEDYEVDNSDSWFVDSLQWDVSDVVGVD